MNELEQLIRERLALIDAARVELDALAASVEQGLYDVLVNQYDGLIDDFSRFYAIYSQFTQTEYLPLVQEVVTTLRNVQQWNEDYFRIQQVSRLNQIGDIVEQRLLSSYGLTSTGETIPGGYIDGLVKHPGAKQNVADFLLRESISKRAKPVALKELSTLVRGTAEQPGQYRLLFDQFVYDRLQEADRVTQTVYAEELDLQAAIYTGGKIDSTRAFCVARTGKVFTLDEIKKFGTSADTYGGYKDKASGTFAGKPKGGYNPLMQAGGFSCRHSYGFVTNRTALRLRPDLKEVNGKLIAQ